jgi:hypothetical protein
LAANLSEHAALEEGKKEACCDQYRGDSAENRKKYYFRVGTQ